MSCLIDYSIKAAFFFLFAILISACELDPSNNVGGSLNPLDGNVGVLFTDTLTVQSSTVLVDSVVTVGSFPVIPPPRPPARFRPAQGGPSLLIGQYDDPQQGRVTARSFFQVEYAARVDLGPSPIIDSVRFIMFYDSVTNNAVTQQIRLHRLVEPIDPARNYTSKEQIGFESNPIGEFVFSRPANRSGLIDTIRFPVDMSVGRRLISNYINTLTLADFIKAESGFALTSGFKSNGVSRFRTINAAGNTRAGIWVYFRNPGDTVSLPLPFFIQNQLANIGVTTMFNQITHDRTGTPLAPLRQSYDELPASATGEQTYIQSGTGLVTKVVIPHFNQIYRNRNVVINDAKLILTPSRNGIFSSSQPLPASLALYEVQSNGRFPTVSQVNRFGVTENFYIPLTSVFGDTNAQLAQAGTLRRDGTYVFNITDYLQRLVLNRQLPANQQLPDRGLFVSVPSGNPFGAKENTVTGAVVGSQRNPVNPLKLIVYYTFVNSN